jgi:hypothetical protein
MEGTAYSQH